MKRLIIALTILATLAVPVVAKAQTDTERLQPATPSSPLQATINGSDLQGSSYNPQLTLTNLQ